MSVSVLNTTSSLSGKTLAKLEDTQTFTGQKTFDVGASAPFVVVSGSAKVANLDADKLDGQTGADYHDATLLTGAVPAASLPNTIDLSTVCGRLTLTTALPVTTADVTAAGTLFYALYKGNRIALYTGTAWQLFTIAQLSIAVPAAANQVYDAFVDYNVGVPALTLTAWTNDTTRATALALQDGVLVLSGSTGKRYVGTVRTVTASQLNDSFALRHVWNYYNRVHRALRVTEATDSWTYDSGTYRQANGAAGNQLDVVVGVAEVPISVQVYGAISHNVGSVAVSVSIGEDATNATATGTLIHRPSIATAAIIYAVQATLVKYPAVGRHFYAWIESGGGATTTWYGDNGGATFFQSGIQGVIEG